MRPGRQLLSTLAGTLVLVSGTVEAGLVVAVSTVADSGPGSLRQAIIDTNESPGADRIVFDIPEGDCAANGVCLIPVLSDLPTITDAVTIDGTTQPRFGTAPANVCARPGIPSHMRVELAGDFAVSNLVLESPEPSVIRGLSIGGSVTSGVEINSGAAHWVHCNHLGVDAAGSTMKPLDSGACFTCAGGASFEGHAVLGTDGDGINDVAERNVIVAVSTGIYHNASSGFTVAGNYIGLGADGTTRLGSGTCVFARIDASDSTYGSDLDGLADENEGNTLACEVGFRFQTNPGASGNLVAGNWIGLDAREAVVAHQIGVHLTSETTSVQVTANRFVGAARAAVVVEGAATVPGGSVGNCIEGNTLGVEHAGTVVLDVADNWWGDPSGPAGIGPGSGDGISEVAGGTTIFAPWLMARPASCDRSLLHRDGFEGLPPD